MGERSIEYKADKSQGTPTGMIHVLYTWNTPPSVIKDKELVTIKLHQEIKNNFTGNYYYSRMLGCEARVDTRDLSGVGHLSYFQGKYPDGTEAQTGGRGALSPKFEHQSYIQDVSTISLSREFGDQYRAAKPGEKRSIEIKVILQKEQVGKRYTYEYKEVGGTVPTKPSSDIIINIDNKPLKTDVPPIILDGRTMVPLRAIFEALGMDVEYIASTMTIVGTKGDSRIQLTVNSTPGNGQRQSSDPGRAGYRY